MSRSPAARLLIVAIVLAGLVLGGAASAETEVQHHERMARRAMRELRRAKLDHRRELRELSRARARAQAVLRPRSRADLVRLAGMQRWATRELRRTGMRLGRERRRYRVRSKRLLRTQAGHTAWLWTYAVFEECPVPGYSAIYDDFGHVVDLPGVPRHIHMGSDVTAPYGSRIVAPFDGNAVASSSVHGGLQVRVYGRRGYVYNAHLSAFGRLGWVRAGDTIGYVGSTGDSTAPHDHIEWHPGDGGAVDPFAYLYRSCVG